MSWEHDLSVQHAWPCHGHRGKEENPDLKGNPEMVCVFQLILGMEKTGGPGCWVTLKRRLVVLETGTRSRLLEGLNRAYRGFPLKSAQVTSMILLEEYLFLTGSLMHE